MGDYVWGRDGLDAIVTQIMNQMEGTGPPPMPEDKVKEIPGVSITQSQVGKCFRSFTLYICTLAILMKPFMNTQIANSSALFVGMISNSRKR